MPHAEHLVRVAAAWEEARMKPFLSEAERVAHHFLTMLEAALGHPLPPPQPPEEDGAPVAEPAADAPMPPEPMPEAPVACVEMPVAPEVPAALDEAPTAPEMPMTDIAQRMPPT